jgi:hypothetical protein
MCSIDFKWKFPNKLKRPESKSVLFYFKANIGCFPGYWQSWDLFTNSLTQSLIQSSQWSTNIWQPGQNVFAWTSTMTIAQCVSYCNTLGFFLAGLAQGLNLLIHLLNYRDFCLYFFILELIVAVVKV